MAQVIDAAGKLRGILGRGKRGGARVTPGAAVGDGGEFAAVDAWVLLGSVVLGRLIMTKRLPAALQPVTAMEVAPAALAGVAWFALTAGRGVTVIDYAIGGPWS
jgi:hypothetical protein